MNYVFLPSFQSFSDFMTTQDCPLLPPNSPILYSTSPGPHLPESRAPSRVSIPQFASHTYAPAVLRPNFIFLYPFYSPQNGTLKTSITIYHPSFFILNLWFHLFLITSNRDNTVFTQFTNTRILMVAKISAQVTRLIYLSIFLRYI